MSKSFTFSLKEKLPLVLTSRDAPKFRLPKIFGQKCHYRFLAKRERKKKSLFTLDLVNGYPTNTDHVSG